VTPGALIPHTSPQEAAARRRLSELRAQLADRERQLADLKTQLRAFEAEYMLRVGTLYAALDEWEAKIAEREVDLYDSEEARQRAAESRRRADETYKAAYEVEQASEAVEPSLSLKSLFREVAKRIHPDFARDAEEQQHFTRLMAQANLAYTRGEAHTLQRLLDDHHEINLTLAVEGAAAKLQRIERQTTHATRDLEMLEIEREALLHGEIASLRKEAEAAGRGGRDLLSELANGLREKVADAQRRFFFIDRQAHAQR
jgi:hypothetical protein